MNNLLDTQILIWFFEGDKALSSQAKIEIENPANTNFVSVVSF